MRWTAAGLVLGTMLARGGTAGAVADPIDDTFAANPLDLTDLSACHTPTALVLRMVFTDAVVPPPNEGPLPANALYGFVDLDLDGNGGTGSLSHVENFGPTGAGTELGVEAGVLLSN